MLSREGVVYLGVDIDHGAIAAARLLSRNHRHCEFAEGSFEVLEGAAVDLHIDVCLLLNWAHSVPPTTLSDKIQLVRDRGVEYLILDSIKEGVTGYAYRHTRDQLDQKFGSVIVIDDIDEVRDLLVLKFA